MKRPLKRADMHWPMSDQELLDLLEMPQASTHKITVEDVYQRLRVEAMWRGLIDEEPY